MITQSTLSPIAISKQRNDKKRFDFFLVSFEYDLERAQFLEAKSQAVLLSGWYSRAWNGTPCGFGFRDQNAANEFAEWLREFTTQNQCGIREKKPETRPRSTSIPTRINPADRLRELAERLTKTIERKLAPLTQNWTARRGKMEASRNHDGRNLQRLQNALNTLADKWDSGQVPAEFQALTNKSDILPYCETTADQSRGYYSYVENPNEWRIDSDFANRFREFAGIVPASADEIRKQTIKQKIDDLRGKNLIEGFFPTPNELAQRLVDLAEVERHHVTGELSAGFGSIAELLRPLTSDLRLCEINFSLREILELRGFNLIGFDCLDLVEPVFDRIVINPPFDRGLDLKHIKKAAELLAPNGRLISLMADRTKQWFDDWLESAPGITSRFFNVSGEPFASSDAFNNTQIRCRIIQIERFE